MSLIVALLLFASPPQAVEELPLMVRAALRPLEAGMSLQEVDRRLVTEGWYLSRPPLPGHLSGDPGERIVEYRKALMALSLSFAPARTHALAFSSHVRIRAQGAEGRYRVRGGTLIPITDGDSPLHRLESSVGD